MTGRFENLTLIAGRRFAKLTEITLDEKKVGMNFVRAHLVKFRTVEAKFIHPWPE